MKKELVVIGIVERNSKILLIKRIKEEGNLIWAFPGGKVESNESEQEAVEREIFEETNIKCNTIKKIGQRIHPDTNKIISYHLCNYISGEIKINNKTEVKEANWVLSSEALKNITSNLFPPVKKYLDTL